MFVLILYSRKLVYIESYPENLSVRVKNFTAHIIY